MPWSCIFEMFVNIVCFTSADALLACSEQYSAEYYLISYCLFFEAHDDHLTQHCLFSLEGIVSARNRYRLQSKRVARAVPSLSMPVQQGPTETLIRL
jgi:hypothetical protein